VIDRCPAVLPARHSHAHAAHHCHRPATCTTYYNGGGWGAPSPGSPAAVDIPNSNVFIYNNVLMNPSTYRTQWSHFSIAGTRRNLLPTIPSTARGDSNLQIRGNVIWNGPTATGITLGIYDPSYAPYAGCAPSNPTCNSAQLLSANKINTVRPDMIGPASGNFRPVAGGSLYAAGLAAAIPGFPVWAALPAPAQSLANTVARDKAGAVRAVGDPPGAFRA
jgi:hypothetical protein